MLARFLQAAGSPLAGGAGVRPESAVAAPLRALLDSAAVRLREDAMPYAERLAERLFVGDEVELTVNVPGHRWLQAGLRGRVVISGDDAPGNLVSVRAQGRLWLLQPQHLRRVAYARRFRARA